MEILSINSLIVGLLNSVMVNCELYRRNYDFERFSPQYHRTAVAATVWQQSIASIAHRASYYGLRSLRPSQLLPGCRDCCVFANTSHYYPRLLS